MGFAQRTLRFGSGLVFGAAIGTALSVLLAPQSGEELKAEITDRIEEAKRAGEEAELLETERLKRLFREAVHDPSALTGKFEGEKRLEDPQMKAQERAHKEEVEAEEARKAVQKAEEQLRKTQEQSQKQLKQAEEQARKARETAATEEAEAAQARNLANTPPTKRG